MRKLLLAGTVLMTIVMLLAACGPKPTEAPAPTKPPEATKAPEPTKAPAPPAEGESLKIMTHVVNELQVNKTACERALTQDLFATQEVYKRVKEGVPFREAYQQVAETLFPKDQKK